MPKKRKQVLVGCMLACVLCSLVYLGRQVWMPDFQNNTTENKATDFESIRKRLCSKSFVHTTFSATDLFVTFSPIPADIEKAFPKDFTPVYALASNDYERFKILTYVEENGKVLSSKLLQEEHARLVSLIKGGLEESADRAELLSETLKRVERIIKRQKNG